LTVVVDCLVREFAAVTWARWGKEPKFVSFRILRRAVFYVLLSCRASGMNFTIGILWVWVFIAIAGCFVIAMVIH
jgi:hypothetical protein